MDCCNKAGSLGNSSTVDPMPSTGGYCATNSGFKGRPRRGLFLCLSASCCTSEGPAPSAGCTCGSSANTSHLVTVGMDGEQVCGHCWQVTSEDDMKQIFTYVGGDLLDPPMLLPYSCTASHVHLNTELPCMKLSGLTLNMQATHQ